MALTSPPLGRKVHITFSKHKNRVVRGRMTMGIRWRMLTYVLAGALSVFVLGSSAEQGRAAVGDKDKITCMYPVWVGFGPIHLANALGYFKEEGIAVEEILDDDMPNAIAAMERGDIHCYLLTV